MWTLKLLKRRGIRALLALCFLAGIAYPLDMCIARKIDDTELQEKISEILFRMTSSNPAITDAQIHQMGRTFFQIYKQMLNAPPGKDGDEIRKQTEAMMEKMFGKVWSRVDSEVKKLVKE